MNARSKKVAAAMAAVVEFVRREEEARPLTAALPSRWAAAGREQIMNGGAQVIARLHR
jgi:hypothetical protein